MYIIDLTRDWLYNLQLFLGILLDLLIGFENCRFVDQKVAMETLKTEYLLQNQVFNMSVLLYLLEFQDPTGPEF